MSIAPRNRLRARKRRGDGGAWRGRGGGLSAGRVFLGGVGIGGGLGGELGGF